MNPFIEELSRNLSTSDAKLRKHWAQRIVDEKIPVSSLMVLLHFPNKTAQRFTWLIGDLLESDRTVVKNCLPLLFSLRDQMPFPGMQRTVAKCLWYLGVPDALRKEATEELFRWLDDDQFAVGVKHYASKALYDLALENKIDVKRLASILDQVPDLIFLLFPNHSDRSTIDHRKKSQFCNRISLQRSKLVG